MNATSASVSRVSSRFALRSADVAPVAGRVHVNGQPGKVRVPAKEGKILTAKAVEKIPQSVIDAEAKEREAQSVRTSPKSTQSNTSKEGTAVATTKTKVPAKKAPKRVITKAAKHEKTNRCACGCGTLCFGTFAPGHDARLKGMLWRGEVKNPNAVQLAFAKKHSIKIGSKKPAPKKIKAGK